MTGKPVHPLPPDLPVDEAHAFALLVWARQQAGYDERDEVLPYSAAITRRHTDALALERADLLHRRSAVPREGQ